MNKQYVRQHISQKLVCLADVSKLKVSFAFDKGLNVQMFLVVVKSVAGCYAVHCTASALHTESNSVTIKPIYSAGRPNDLLRLGSVKFLLLMQLPVHAEASSEVSLCNRDSPDDELPDLNCFALAHDYHKRLHEVILKAVVGQLIPLQELHSQLTQAVHSVDSNVQILVTAYIHKEV